LKHPWPDPNQRVIIKRSFLNVTEPKQ